MLLVILFTIKEVASAKMRIHQAGLRNVAPDLCEIIFRVYYNLSKKWMNFLEFGGEDEDKAMDGIESSLLALRTIRRILTIGFDNPNRNDTVVDIWITFNMQLPKMLRLISQDSDLTLELEDRPKEYVERHLMQIAKLHLSMARNYPAAFVLLPNSPGLAQSYWSYASDFGDSYGKKKSQNLKIGSNGDFGDEDEISFPERFTLKGLLLIRACTKMVFNPAQSFKYPTEDDKKEKAEAIKIIKRDLINPSFAREIMETIVAKFFVFTPRDLKQWGEEPDEWEKSQEGMGDDWEFSVRVCSEKLFLESVIYFKEDLVSSLTNVISNAIQLSSNNVWLKESTFAAIGLAAPALHKQFDFKTFLSNTLTKEVQTQQPDYNIIRRRVAILLAQWVPVQEGLDRPLIYQIFQHLLDPGDQLNDEVVRVTTGRKLADVLEQFDFSAEQLAPFAQTFIHRLLKLVEEVDLPETKLAVLNSLHVLVVKMEHHIIPFGDQILGGLPPLWQAAGAELILKENIMAILTALVESMKDQSRRFHLELVPLLESSTGMGTQPEVMLAEEALNLWSAILEHTPSESPPQAIIDLLGNLIPMLELASETLDRALSILEAYIYLIPAEMFKPSIASLIHGRLVRVLDSTRREPIGLVVHALDKHFCSAFHVGGVEATRLLTHSLITTDFLSTVISHLREAHSAHQTTGPNARISPIDGVVEADYFALLARIALASPTLFFEAYSHVRPEERIDWLLEEWFGHIDNMSHPDRKKLSCLALTAMVETAQPFVLRNLQLLLTMWTSILTELEGEDQRDCLLITASSLGDWETPTPGARRSREFLLLDPVHSVDMRGSVQEKLGVAIARVGGMEAFNARWAGDVDGDVMRGFVELNVI